MACLGTAMPNAPPPRLPGGTVIPEALLEVCWTRPIVTRSQREMGGGVL